MRLKPSIVMVVVVYVSNLSSETVEPIVAVMVWLLQLVSVVNA
jgi:hypothetical protein